VYAEKIKYHTSQTPLCFSCFTPNYSISRIESCSYSFSSQAITSPRSRRAFNGFLVTANVLITIKKSSHSGANAALFFLCATEARGFPSSRLRETWRKCCAFLHPCAIRIISTHDSRISLKSLHLSISSHCSHSLNLTSQKFRSFIVV